MKTLPVDEFLKLSYQAVVLLGTLSNSLNGILANALFSLNIADNNTMNTTF